MTGGLFAILVLAWLGVAAIAFGVLMVVDAPYGKRERSGWGPGIPNKLAWCLMEAVVLVAFHATFVLAGGAYAGPVAVFAALLTLHYVNRAFVYPWRTRTTGKTMPLTIMLASVAFNTVNGLLLGWDFSHLDRAPSWFTDPRFLVGMVLFVVGLALNWDSDHRLLHLRRPGETGYRIPRRGAFRWVSCPNLLGEIVEWVGFSLLTWSLSGLAFAVWTLANLVPRARATHRWYRERFPEYPPERRALLPGLW